jgi:hypothetical protein
MSDNKISIIIASFNGYHKHYNEIACIEYYKQSIRGLYGNIKGCRTPVFNFCTVGTNPQLHAGQTLGTGSIKFSIKQSILR